MSQISVALECIFHTRHIFKCLLYPKPKPFTRFHFLMEPPQMLYNPLDLWSSHFRLGSKVILWKWFRLWYQTLICVTHTLTLLFKNSFSQNQMPKIMSLNQIFHRNPYILIILKVAVIMGHVCIGELLWRTYFRWEKAHGLTSISDLWVLFGSGPVKAKLPVSDDL